MITMSKKPFTVIFANITSALANLQDIIDYKAHLSIMAETKLTEGAQRAIKSVLYDTHSTIFGKL